MVGKLGKEANHTSQTVSNQQTALHSYICKTGMDVVFRFSFQYNSPFFGYRINITKMQIKLLPTVDCTGMRHTQTESLKHPGM